MIGVQLRPVDTCFFRDGTPFAADSAPQEGVGKMFPPYPTTVAGALRAALALGNGWHGRGRWPQTICNVLGNGPDDLGSVAFDCPFLLRCGQPLFRAPRHLLGVTDDGRWTPRIILRPGSEVACDLGMIRLPEASRTDPEPGDLSLKTGDDEWLTQNGMNAVLRGELPDHGDIVPSGCLWSEEPRIGLEIDRGRRAAKEGMLYSTRHVRPERRVSLGARIAGLPADWTFPFGRLVPLGGEGRLAECTEWKAGATLEAPIAAIESGRSIVVIALSPLDLEPDVCDGRSVLAVAELGGVRVVSACLDRPQRIGGWDSETRRPLPLRGVLPPGSVLFCEVPDPVRLRDTVVARDGTARLGARQNWGFGLVALGLWPDEQ